MQLTVYKYFIGKIPRECYIYFMLIAGRVHLVKLKQN
jgi:hypothetical protein